YTKRYPYTTLFRSQGQDSAGYKAALKYVTSTDILQKLTIITQPNCVKFMKNNYLNQLKGKWLCLLSAFMLISGLSFAQNTAVTGVVKSEGDMESIPGASILIKGTTRGTTTNLDGEFSIQASPGEVLMISFIGYSTKEVTVTSQTSNLEIILN